MPEATGSYSRSGDGAAEMPRVKLATVTDLPEGHDLFHLPALMVIAGMAESVSSSRRLIDAGAVRVGGERVAPGRHDFQRAEIEGKPITVGNGRTWGFDVAPGALTVELE